MPRCSLSTAPKCDTRLNHPKFDTFSSENLRSSLGRAVQMSGPCRRMRQAPRGTDWACNDSDSAHSHSSSGTRATAEPFARVTPPQERQMTLPQVQLRRRTFRFFPAFCQVSFRRLLQPLDIAASAHCLFRACSDFVGIASMPVDTTQSQELSEPFVILSGGGLLRTFRAYSKNNADGLLATGGKLATRRLGPPHRRSGRRRGRPHSHDPQRP